jgi:hypothetical protein
MAFKVPERFRVTAGILASQKATHGNNGMFLIPLRDPATQAVLQARAMASDQEGWEHVSVSFQSKTPSWDVMCTIKDLFWGPTDWVVQYHPPEREYVNFSSALPAHVAPDRPSVPHPTKPPGRPAGPPYP